MVAKITFPATVARALNYNEQKVKKGVAECFHAHHFLKEAKGLNFYEKQSRFGLLNALNKRAKTNTLHVSLNFHPDERLNREVLIKIAATYMEKIGFAEQPYLVYRHTDAGHPHLHIVTTNIQKNGKRIPTHNIGKDRSAKARKEIEIAFKLARAEESKPQAKRDVLSTSVQRAHYGGQPTKQAIAGVVHHVLAHYTFSSLPELNAVLRLYNVTAERGTAESTVYQTGGLLYKVLDDKGKPVGVPVKASSLYGKPTLRFLEEKFKRNERIKTGFKKGLQSRLDWVLLKNPKSLAAFKQHLEGERISLVIRQNEQGIVYGLTYVDQATKSVFNGSDLGKPYTAAAVLKKIETRTTVVEEKDIQTKLPTGQKADQQRNGEYPNSQRHTTDILNEIVNPVEQSEAIPNQLKKQKKKKRISL